MKKLTLLFAFVMITALSFGQVFIAPNWMVSNDVEYADNPIVKPEASAIALADFTVIETPEAFDALWTEAGDVNLVGNKTGHGDFTGTNYFDLDAEGEGTFGGAWKAVHHDRMLYVLVKFLDTEGVAEHGMKLEVMTQPVNSFRNDTHMRWEPTFEAGEDIRDRNKAYLRFWELGGFKTQFTKASTADLAAEDGVYGLRGADGEPDWVGGGFAGDAKDYFFETASSTYWNLTDGIYRIVLAYDFEQALGYFADPGATAFDDPKVALEIGDQVIFDIKTNAWITGTENADRLDHFWASDENDAYANTRFNGLLNIESITSVPSVVELNQPRVYVANSTLYVRGSEPVSLEVYSVLGARVKVAENVTTLDLSDLKNGIYVVRVQGDRQGVKVLKY